MKEEKGKNILIIIVLLVIVVTLITFIVLVLTNTININIGKNNTNESSHYTVDNSLDDETGQVNSEEENKVTKLKEKLLDETWVKDNLYSKKDCFGKDVNLDNQKLTFNVLQDNSGNPIVIVLDLSYDDFVVVPYKVYVNDGIVKVDNIIGQVGHPSHIGFSVDQKQGLVIGSWGHMGNYSFKAYDVKDNEIKVVDEYDCKTGNCDYEYKGNKEYNLTGITIELTKDNIEKYVSETIIYSYSYEDIYAVYTSEKTSNNKEYYLTLHKKGNFVYNYDSKTFKGVYIIAGDTIQLNYTSDDSNGETVQISKIGKMNIIDKSKLYDTDNKVNLKRTNIPTNPGE